MTLSPDTQLGPYAIVSQLGSGGMGVAMGRTGGVMPFER